MRAVDALMECLKLRVWKSYSAARWGQPADLRCVYDAGIRHVLVRHEAGGGHAAEGYAKATGKVGVAVATSGPVRRTSSPR